MPRTPDRFPGEREDEGIVLRDQGPAGLNSGNPAVAGGVRYVTDRFKLRDHLGTFNGRSVFVSPSASPTVADDNSQGFSVGMFWLREDTDALYVCQDSTNGAAVWSAIGGAGSLLTDGDKGDITVSGGGAAFTVDNNAITNAKVADVPSPSLKGRTTSGAGDPEDLTLVNSTTNGWNTATPGSISVERAALTGDITAPANSNTTAIAAGVIVDADINSAAAIAQTKTGALIGDVTKASGSDTTAIAAGVIVDSDVNAAAGIAQTKTGALTGDVTKASGSDVTAIASGVIVDSDINSAAGIGLGKLAAQPANTLVGNPTASPATPTTVAIAADSVPARVGGNLTSHPLTTLAGAGLTYASGEVNVGSSTSIVVGASDVQRAALTGDVTAAQNANATTIAANAVTNAKAADVPSPSLKGRTTATTGDPEDLTLVASTSNTWNTSTGGSVSVERAALTGDITAAANSNATTLANNAVSNAKAADMAGNTIKGNDTATLGDPVDIAIGTNTVLGRQGTNIVAAPVATAQVADDAITNVKAANVPSPSLKGRTTAATGDPEDLTLVGSTSNTWNTATAGSISVERAALTGDVTASANSNATTIAASAVTTAKVANDAIDNTKLANMASPRLKGRTTATTGDPEDLTLTNSTSVTWNTATGAAISVERAALTGVIAAAANANATTFSTGVDGAGLALSAGNTVLDVVGSTSIVVASDQVQRAALTGDVTAAQNANATTIAANAVTNAKAADVPSPSLKGRTTATTGDPEDLTLANSTSATWNTATGGAISVERAALTGDITAAANSNATTLANNSVSNAKAADMAGNTVKGNDTATLGDPVDIAVGANTLLGRVAGNIVAAQAVNAQITGGGLGTVKGVALAGVAGTLQDLTGLQLGEIARFGNFQSISLAGGATHNDVAVTAGINVLFISITGAGDATVTGFSLGGGGAAQAGATLRVIKLAGTGRILLPHQNVGSVANNQLINPNGVTWILTSNEEEIVYARNSPAAGDFWRAVATLTSNASMAEMAANTVKANATAGSATPTDVAIGANTVLGRQGANIVAAQVATAQIANAAVTNAKLANMAASTVKGQPVGGSGEPVDLSTTQLSALITKTWAETLAAGTTSGTNNPVVTAGQYLGFGPAPPTGGNSERIRSDGALAIYSNAGVAVRGATASSLITTTGTATLQALSGDAAVTGSAAANLTGGTSATATATTGSMTVRALSGNTAVNASNDVLINAAHDFIADGAATTNIRAVSGAVNVTTNGQNAVQSTNGNVLVSAGSDVSVSAGTGFVSLTAGSFVAINNFLRMTEQAASTPSLAAAQGLLWVKNDTPNNPYFTDDTNTDRRIATVPIPNAQITGGGLGTVKGVAIGGVNGTLADLDGLQAGAIIRLPGAGVFLSGPQPDYNIAEGAHYLDVGATTDVTFTGFACGGGNAGAWFWLTKFGAANRIIIKHQDTLSIPANRVNTPGAVDYVLAEAGHGVLIAWINNRLQVVASTRVSDGDKGDITVSNSGAIWTLDDDVVDNARLSNMSAARVKGQSVGGSGDPVDLDATQLNAIVGSANLTLSNALLFGTSQVFNSATFPWDITLNANTTRLFLNVTGDGDVTSITASTIGRIVIFQSVTTGSKRFVHLSGGAGATKFICPLGVDYHVGPRENLLLLCDGGNGWLVMPLGGSSATTAATVYGRALGAGTGAKTDLSGAQVGELVRWTGTQSFVLPLGPNAIAVTAGRTFVFVSPVSENNVVIDEITYGSSNGGARIFLSTPTADYGWHVILRSNAAKPLANQILTPGGLDFDVSSLNEMIELVHDGGSWRVVSHEPLMNEQTFRGRPQGSGVGPPTSLTASEASTILGATRTEVVEGLVSGRLASPNAIAALWDQPANNAGTASTITIADGGFVALSGSTATPISAFQFTPLRAGRTVRVLFLTIRVITHSATLICPGAASITTAVGDVAEVTYDGVAAVYRVTAYHRANGEPVAYGTMVPERIKGRVVNSGSGAPADLLGADVAAILEAPTGASLLVWEDENFKSALTTSTVLNAASPVVGVGGGNATSLWVVRSINGTNTTTALTAGTGYVGALQVSTGATSGNDIALMLSQDRGSTANGGAIVAFSSLYQIDFWLRITTATGVFMRVGVGKDAGDNDLGSDSAYFELDSAASAWKVGTRASGSGPAAVAGAAIVTATYSRLTIRRTTAARVDFFLNGTLIQNVTTNIPTATVMPIVKIKSTTSGAKSFNIDRVRIITLENAHTAAT